MDALTERVRRAAVEAGADLVGFAPVSRFEGAPAEVHPHTIFPQTRTGIAVAVREPRGAVEGGGGGDGVGALRVVGAAAGLGELGHSKVLLTPQFGPRQRVFAVFTDAELEPTPLFEGSVCDGCKLCVKECEAC